MWNWSRVVKAPDGRPLEQSLEQHILRELGIFPVVHLICESPIRSCASHSLTLKGDIQQVLWTRIYFKYILLNIPAISHLRCSSIDYRIETATNPLAAYDSHQMTWSRSEIFINLLYLHDVCVSVCVCVCVCDYRSRTSHTCTFGVIAAIRKDLKGLKSCNNTLVVGCSCPFHFSSVTRTVH